jgi:hypothetical protein
MRTDTSQVQRPSASGHGKEWRRQIESEVPIRHEVRGFCALLESSLIGNPESAEQYRAIHPGGEVNHLELSSLRRRYLDERVVPNRVR